MVSEEGLKEFIQLYKEEYGVLLTTEKALEKAIPVFNLIKTLIKPEKEILDDSND